MGASVHVSSDTSTAERAPAPPGGSLIGYQPALDGVRALAVAVVFLFHAGVPGFDGGYLGVSVFFTLSGFLITTLLTAEIRSTEGVALGEFYARRARRLLPASVLVVMLIAVMAAVTDWFDAIDELRAQSIGSLLQIANWVFLAGEGSYQDLLEETAGAASPLEHYWSLAIEEQFYWVWPLAFLGLWRLGRSDRGRLVVLGVLTAVAAIAAPVIAAVWGADAAYWSTPARAAEILVGALAGYVVFGRAVPGRLALLAPASLAVLAAAVVLFPSRGGPAYAGALPLIGLVSVGLLVGLQADSATRRWCSSAPLVWLGKISYGVYLFHWPVFVVLDEDRVGVGGPALFAIRLAVTMAISQVSFTFFEQPIRRGRGWTVRRSLGGAAALTATAVALAWVLVPGPSGAYWTASDETTEAAAIVVDDTPLTPLAPVPEPSDEAATGEQHSDAAAVDGDPPAVTADPDPAPPEPAVPETPDGAADADPAEPGPPDSPAADEPAPTGAADATAEVPVEPEPLAVPSRPVRMVIVGDSTAEAFGTGLVRWAAAEPEWAQVEVLAVPGCGLVRGGEILHQGTWTERPEGCTNYFYDAVLGELESLSPDVVALATSSWDVLDRRWPDSPPDADPDIAASEDRVSADFTELSRRFLDAGTSQVVWLEMPTSDVDWAPDVIAQEDPRRHAVLHRAMASAASSLPGRISVLDFDGWFAEQGLDVDREVRPDGVHPTPESAEVIARDFLGEQLVRIALGLV